MKIVLFFLFMVIKFISVAQTVDSTKLDTIAEKTIIGTYLYSGTMNKREDKFIFKPDNSFEHYSHHGFPSGRKSCEYGTWEIKNDTLIIHREGIKYVLRKKSYEGQGIPVKYVFINYKMYDCPVKNSNLNNKYWIKEE